MNNTFQNINLLFFMGFFLVACSSDHPDLNIQKVSKYSNEIPGLKMRTLIKGSGETANYGDTLKMHYTGWLYDANTINNHGNKFDSSLDRGKLFEFKLGVDPLIKGWELGVTNMSVGENRELIISPEMGYGDRSLGGIPPQSTLLFHVELMDLVKID